MDSSGAFILEVIMAIKVIEYGKKRVKCDNCECILQYEKSDVRITQRGINEWQSEITCPVCGNKIDVK